MITARIPFQITLAPMTGSAEYKSGHRETHTARITVEIEGPYDECPLSEEQTKEMLVQIAISLTKPEYLDELVRDLTAQPRKTKGSQFALPKASRLRRVK